MRSGLSRRSIIRPTLSKRAVSVSFVNFNEFRKMSTLSVGVDGRGTVFQIHDGRDCSFQDHVGDPGGIVAGDRARAIDPDLQVQAVVAQKNRGRRAWLTQKTDELLRARQGGSRAAKLDDKLPVFDRVSGRCLWLPCSSGQNVSRISRARAITPRRAPCCSRCRGWPRHPPGSRPCRRARRRASPSGRWRH